MDLGLEVRYGEEKEEGGGGGGSEKDKEKERKRRCAVFWRHFERAGLVVVIHS